MFEGVGRIFETNQARLQLLRAHFQTSAIMAEHGDMALTRHLEAVSRYTGLLAEWLELSCEDQKRMEIAVLAHDLGKARIPRELLLKPGRLQPEEYVYIKSHSEAGLALLNLIEQVIPRDWIDERTFYMAKDVAMYHHENWDGSGYPHGMKGMGIPCIARIARVADVVDALLSVRPYKAAWSWDEVRAELLNGSGRLFDPTVIDVLFAHEHEFLVAIERREVIEC